MTSSSTPEDRQPSAESVKVALRGSPEIAAGMAALSRHVADIGRMVDLTAASSLRESLAQSMAPFSQGLAEQNRKTLAPILDAISHSSQVNESIRRLAQQSTAFNLPNLSLSEVIRNEEQVQHVGSSDEEVADSAAAESAYVLHEELLSFLKKNRTEPGVITVLTLLFVYLAGKDEILESAQEHAADVQRVLKELWDFAALLLVWLGRATS